MVIASNFTSICCVYREKIVKNNDSYRITQRPYKFRKSQYQTQIVHIQFNSRQILHIYIMHGVSKNCVNFLLKSLLFTILNIQEPCTSVLSLNWSENVILLVALNRCVVSRFSWSNLVPSCPQAHKNDKSLMTFKN